MGHVPQDHAAADQAGHPGRGADGIRDLDRRLRDVELRQRRLDPLPRLCVQRGQDRDPAAGLRVRHRDLLGRNHLRPRQHRGRKKASLRPLPRALANTGSKPYWLDQPAAPDPLPPLHGTEQAELAVIGGGFSGLWTALLAKERDPGRNVVLVEGRRIAWGGTGRNGGFCSASITHGLGNGLDRFPREIDALERLGRENLDQIERAVARYAIDCDFARTGELAVATEPWQLGGLAQAALGADRLGVGTRLLDAGQVRAELNSPTYLGGLWDPDGCATVDPARLAWGLRRACLAAGVRVYEHTPVTAIRSGSAAGRLTLSAPRWPRGPSRRCCAGSGTTWSRSTTTCW